LLIGGAWYYNGLTYPQWQEYANTDPDVYNYYTTNVVPAYEQYQADPSSVRTENVEVPSYDSEDEVDDSGNIISVS
jgi:hypothetical protein